MEVLDRASASAYPSISVPENRTPVVGFFTPDFSPYVVFVPSTGSRTRTELMLFQPKWHAYGDQEPRQGLRSSDIERFADLLQRVETLASQLRRIEDQMTVAHQVVPDPHLEALRWMEVATGLSQERIGDLLGVSRQTLRNWREGSPVAAANRQRIFAVRDVLERAALRYPTQPQLTAWLDTPQGGEGRTPAQLLQAGNIEEARYWALADNRFKVTPSRLKRGTSDSERGWSDLTRKAQYRDQDEELLAIYGQPGGVDEDD